VLRVRLTPVNDLSSINHDLPLGTITPHLHTLPPEPIVPTRDVLSFHLITSYRARYTWSGGSFIRTKEFVDGILILTLAVGHVQDRANEGS
jgi:hypothetical protein